MSAVRGFVVGLAGLAMLEVVVTNAPATGRIGDVFDLAATGLNYWFDPSTPLIPNIGNCVPGSSLGGGIGSDIGGAASDLTGGLLSKTTPTGKHPKRRKTKNPTLV